MNPDKLKLTYLEMKQLDSFLDKLEAIGKVRVCACVCVHSYIICFVEYPTAYHFGIEDPCYY